MWLNSVSFELSKFEFYQQFIKVILVSAKYGSQQLKIAIIWVQTEWIFIVLVEFKQAFLLVWKLETFTDKFIVILFF